MKKLNIKRFATSNPDTFEMYTRHTENYDTFGNCISVTVSTVASLDIVQITKNGIDVTSEWSGVPSPYISKVYTSNVTETLTFYGSNGQEYVETIDIISVDANPVIPPEFYASDANIKINSDVKVGKMSLKEIDDTVSALFDLIYPVGSIYYTNNANFSPNVSFNGTWEQIKDVFLLAAGDTYVGGTSGGDTNTGAATGNTGSTTLTINQIPAHNHSASYYVNSNLPGGVDHFLAYGNTNGKNLKTANDTTWIANKGGGKGHTHTLNNHTHTNMPPYIVVYVWKRVS